MTYIHKQRGMTLIELLVSITIGIFIIGAAIFVFQGVSSTGRQVNEITQLRQQGATAFRLIGKQIREAGDIQPTYDAGNYNYKFENAYTWLSQTASVGAWTPPASVTQYLSLVQQEPKGATLDYALNCLGQKATGTKRQSIFYVQDNVLYCRTDGTPQPIINNVAEMVVRYRVKESASTSRFYDAAGFTQWSQVDAVEVCLDLVGTRNTPSGGVPYKNCAGADTDRDNKLHFVQTALFRINPAGMP